MRRTQGFATLVCALLEKDVDSTDLVAVRVAVAWALAWGVLGRALACGETDDVQEPIHEDCSAWLHEHVNAGDDKRIEEACSGPAPRPDLQMFAPWSALADLRREAAEAKRLKATHVVSSYVVAPTPRLERAVFVGRCFLRGMRCLLYTSPSPRDS